MMVHSSSKLPDLHKKKKWKKKKKIKQKKQKKKKQGSLVSGDATKSTLIFMA